MPAPEMQHVTADMKRYPAALNGAFEASLPQIEHVAGGSANKSPDEYVRSLF